MGGMAERKHKLDTDKAVRGAVSATEARLKSREAKLAQLKHVLDKTKFDPGTSVSPPGGNRPVTRSARNAKNQSPSTNNNKVQQYINKNEDPFNNPLSGNEKVRYLLNHK